MSCLWLTLSRLLPILSSKRLPLATADRPVRPRDHHRQKPQTPQRITVFKLASFVEVFAKAYPDEIGYEDVIA